MAVTVAQLNAKISVTGADQAKSDLMSVSSQVSSTGGAIVGALTGAATLAGAALVGIGVVSTKMAADFQTGVTSLVTGAGEAKSNLKSVSDGILSLAPATGTSTKQLTDGMYMIESAGFHGSAGLQVLKNAAMGAKVGSADLGVVANGVTTILTDYGLGANNSALATNVLVATVASGKTHMQDLADSLSHILPTASAFGVSLKDTTAALATMTAEGVPAADAATYLKQTLSSMENPSTKAVKLFKDIGLSSTDVANEMKKSLPDALKMITDHLATKFPAGSVQFNAALSTISGGSKQMQGMLDLTGTHMKTFKDNVSSISDSVKKGGNSISGWSDIQGTFNFKMDKAKEAFEVLGIKIGTVLLPYIGKLLDNIMPIVNNIGNWIINNHILENTINGIINAVKSVTTWVQNASKFFQQHKAALAALQVISIALAGALGGLLVAALVSVGIAGWAAIAPFLAFAAPFIAVGAIIAVVIAGIVLAIQHWSDIVNWFQGQWKRFTDWWGKGMSDFQGLWNTIWGGISNFFKDTWNKVTGFAQSAMPALTAAVLGPETLLVLFIKDHWKQISDFIFNAWNTIKNDAGSAWSWLSNMIGSNVDKLKNAMMSPFNYARDNIGGIVKAFVNTISSTLNLGLTGTENFINAFGNAIDWVAGKLGGGSPIPHFAIPRIPMFASGTDFHQGGLAIVGERGRELVSLPRGSRVMPNDKTEKLMGGKLPGYADGIGGIDIMGMLGQGASAILNAALGAFHVGGPSLGGSLSGITSHVFDMVKGWAISFIHGILPNTATGGGATGDFGSPVNVPGGLAGWIQAAMSLTGVPGSWLNPLEIIAMHESGGNPNAINNWDSNALAGHPSQGLFQTIPGTFAAHALAGHGNILNPIDNAAAAIGYIIGRYGDVFHVPGIVSMSQGGGYVGYADGTNNARGGWSMVGERGPEAMYVPSGAQIIPNNKLGGLGGQTIVVNPPAVYLDGQLLTKGLMPHVVNAIRQSVGTYSL